MQYIFKGLSVVIIMFFVNGILALRHGSVSAEDQTVVLPKFVLIIGIISSGFCLIPAVIVMILNESIALIITFIIFSLLGACLIVAYINCRIIYDEQTFTSKTFFGRKRTFTYDQITAIKGGNAEDIKLYVGKKVVRIDEMAVGKSEFLRFAKKQYRKLNNGNAIPTATVKTDIFNGNIKQPGGFIFVYALVALLLIGVMVYFMIASVPLDAEDLSYESVAFERYEIRDENLLLFTGDDSKYYSVTAYEALLNEANKFAELCDSEEAFDVGYIVYNDGNASRCELQSITGADGTIWLSMEAVHDYHWGDVRKIYLIFGGLIVFWLAIAAVSIYVGRNPEKFSPRFIRLFFKDGYVRRSAYNNKRKTEFKKR